MSSAAGIPSNNDTLPVSTSDVKQPVKIAVEKASGGPASLPPKTIMEQFDAVVEKFGKKQALHVQRVSNGTPLEKTPWTSWTWSEYREQVDAFGKALLSLGFEKFDIINILGFNAPEWFFANFGAIAAGGVSSGIYATNNVEACKYISEHSKAKVVVVEGLHQLAKYYDISGELPHLKALVVYNVDDAIAEATKQKCHVPVYTFADFLKLGSDIPQSDLQARSNSWQCGETCTLIYTSGTTGPPKAVMLTHDNITWVTQVMLTRTRKGYMDNTDVGLSYLPLSHIAAQLLDMHMPMATGFQIYFAQPDALKGSLGITLKQVRPTTFFGVPRVWEKMADKLQAIGKSTTGLKKKLSTFAKKHALEHWLSQQYGETPHTTFCYVLAKKILAKAHKALGFDRCYAFYTAAAPIELATLHYFASLDIPIMEVFGQSENTGPQTVNTYKAFKFGSCGRPMPGTQTKRDEATGEMLFRGRHVFAGYMGMPEKTNETIENDGWLHTGDVIAIDDANDPEMDDASFPSGFVSITGRIKELIITAGGENVPPVLIEDKLKAHMPAVSNAMVIGDKRKFLTVLLCLQVEVDEETGVPTNKLTGVALDTCKQIGSSATTTQQARDDPKWKEYFDAGIAAANKEATSRAQNVGKWYLLDTDFSEIGTELTPTLKLKRSVTAEKYATEIEGMYA